MRSFILERTQCHCFIENKFNLMLSSTWKTYDANDCSQLTWPDYVLAREKSTTCSILNCNDITFTSIGIPESSLNLCTKFDLEQLMSLNNSFCWLRYRNEYVSLFSLLPEHCICNRNHFKHIPTNQ